MQNEIDDSQTEDRIDKEKPEKTTGYFKNIIWIFVAMGCVVFLIMQNNWVANLKSENEEKRYSELQQKQSERNINSFVNPSTKTNPQYSDSESFRKFNVI